MPEDTRSNTSIELGLAQILDQINPQDKGWRAQIPPHWKQGRTAYGGLTAGLMLKAAYLDHTDLPPLRSAMINFVGPVIDDPILTTELLRQGKNVTTIAARASLGANCVGTANMAFGGTRDSALSIGLSAPEAPAPEACEDFTPAAFRDFVPAFFHQFETKLIAGGRPMTGAKEGYIRTWSRHKDPASREGIESLLCIGDVLPPAAMPLFKTMGAISSMTWMFNVLSDDITTEDGWWHVETNLTAGQNGYSSQVMRMWNTRGELVVEGLQNVAMFM